MEVWKDITVALQKSGIKRDIDVCQLYLTRKRLTSVPDLSRFRFLRYLRLNNNKIRELSCRSINCCLTELYLDNNHIKSISGALNHLTCLRILLLHNNELRGLDDTMHELRKMQQLHTANFFLNPLSQEPGYRQHVIHCLPSVQVLDRREVKPEERSRCLQMYRAKRHHVLQSVAFGRRIELPTRREDEMADGGRLPTTHYPLRRQVTNHAREELRSVLQFSMLDWMVFPTSRQRRLGELVQCPPRPRTLTVTLR